MQARFCEEYVIDLNATQAAGRAGYSKRSAQHLGYQLLQNPLVTKRLAELVGDRTERTQITADVVLGELLRLARVDPLDVFDEHGGLLPVKDMPEDVRRAISSIEVTSNTMRGGDTVLTHKIKFWPKNNALQLLGQHLRLFADVVEHKDHDVEQAIREGKRRAGREA